MNNNGIYGGDRRQEALRAAAEAGARGGGFAADPVPTAFVDNARRAVFHHLLVPGQHQDSYVLIASSGRRAGTTDYSGR